MPNSSLNTRPAIDFVLRAALPSSSSANLASKSRSTCFENSRCRGATSRDSL